MEEPSVLDYIKSKLMPWRKTGITLQDSTLQPDLSPKDLQASDTSDTVGLERVETPVVVIQEATISLHWPWRSLVALALALLAQILLEPRQIRTFWPSIFVYLLSAGWLLWAFIKNEWHLSDLPVEKTNPDPFTIRRIAFYLVLVMMPLAFLALSGNRFNLLNLLVWSITVAACLRAFWLDSSQSLGEASLAGESLATGWRDKTKIWLKRLGQGNLQTLKINLSPELILGVGVTLCILFFRLYQLNQVPLEMTSDHAEKLLDVWDILNHDTSIFFIRNTGREPLQFYLTALVTQLFGTGISFISLKIGTTLAGLLTLIYLYRLGKELGGWQVGLLAALMAGIAYWPNLITRIGLRFTFYPLFAAMMIYYLLRGLRHSNRNDLILAGLALGLGLHTYTPARALVILPPLALGLYFFHQKNKQALRQAILWLCIIILVAFVLFLPLLRFAMQYPDFFFYRTITRIGDLEQPLPGPAWQIFLKNLWNASVMFFWDNGEIWSISIPHRPALDIVSAALLFTGLFLVGIRYLRRRNWVDLFLLCSIPLMMLPSILSLAFPNENPALNRTGGAIVPVFLIIAIAFNSLLASIRDYMGGRPGKRTAWIVGLILISSTVLQNYQLVFNQYRRIYDNSSWNTTEVGNVIRNFAGSIGNLDSAWIVPYPYWLDTRLVGMIAGIPTRDYALFNDQLDSTKSDPRTKLFIFKYEDQQTFEQLINLYPEGRLQLYQSQIPTKEFWLFTVLPQQNPSGGIIPQALPAP